VIDAGGISHMPTQQHQQYQETGREGLPFSHPSKEMPPTATGDGPAIE
jgi:hypothetical protein